MKKLNITRKVGVTLKPLLVLYFVIARNLIEWCAFKPLHRAERFISCGNFNRKKWMRTPSKIKWLGRFNYKLAKLSMFYGL